MNREEFHACIYPYGELNISEGYPDRATFEIVYTDDGRGAGVVTRAAFERGERLCKVSGHVIGSRRLHTLQINGNVHLYDPYFCGLLLHSCDPNVFLNMGDMELWALKRIEKGEFLTMDYASTETVLARQFACHCGAPNCRGWISGSKEIPQHGDELRVAASGEATPRGQTH